jgi:hypothetical protein
VTYDKYATDDISSYLARKLELCEPIPNENTAEDVEIISLSSKYAAEYSPAWDATVNRFTTEFIRDFCFPDGRIDWEKFVKLVSEEKPKTRK